MVQKSLRVPRTLLLLALSMPAIAQALTQAGESAPAPTVGPAQDFYVYPKNGQTQQQQWADRYACHGWSKSQSGFDPTRLGGGVPPNEVAERRDQYRRAMTACLEARGYAVRYAAAAPAAPVPPAAAPAVVAPPAPAAAALPPPSAPPPRAAAPVGLRYHPWLVQIDAGYALTEGALKHTLDDGGTVGLGITWFPTAALPLGLRVDGSYSRFGESLESRDLASAATGTNVAFGHQNVYGGDADAQLDLAHGSSSAKMYLFGGFGWYRQQTVFKQLSDQQVEGCLFYYCGPLNVPFVSTVERTTTPWVKSWNAGLGVEFALADPASFFIEARYLRMAPYSANNAFIPIVMGFRF
jgi:Outer membrane protein beta-barrel domain